jgi:hypothetical protein
MDGIGSKSFIFRARRPDTEVVATALDIADVP